MKTCAVGSGVTHPPEIYGANGNRRRGWRKRDCASECKPPGREAGLRRRAWMGRPGSGQWQRQGKNSGRIQGGLKIT
jgi:hypothetical protein